MNTSLLLFPFSVNGIAIGPRQKLRSLLAFSFILHFPLSQPQVLLIPSPKWLLNLLLPSSLCFKSQSTLPSLLIWSPVTAPPLNCLPAPTLGSASIFSRLHSSQWPLKIPIRSCLSFQLTCQQASAAPPCSKEDGQISSTVSKTHQVWSFWPYLLFWPHGPSSAPHLPFFFCRAFVNAVLY